jgi:hypothetical protein
LSRGSSPAGCPAEPLVSYRINRQFSGWNLPPLMIRAFGAHGHIGDTLSVSSIQLTGLINQIRAFIIATVQTIF